VWLDARHIKTLRPQKKLDWKYLGLFLVRRAIGSHAYKLELPTSIKLYPVFYVSLLCPHSEPAPGQTRDLLLLIEVDGLKE